MALKPGTIADFTGSMAEAMDEAFQSEWSIVKDTPLSAAGEEDRKILFVAIAQGVLNYLEENSMSIKTNTTTGGSVNAHEHQVQFDVD